MLASENDLIVIGFSFKTNQNFETSDEQLLQD